MPVGHALKLKRPTYLKLREEARKRKMNKTENFCNEARVSSKYRACKHHYSP